MGRLIRGAAFSFALAGLVALAFSADVIMHRAGRWLGQALNGWVSYALGAVGLVALAALARWWDRRLDAQPNSAVLTLTPRQADAVGVRYSKTTPADDAAAAITQTLNSWSAHATDAEWAMVSLLSLDAQLRQNKTPEQAKADGVLLTFAYSNRHLVHSDLVSSLPTKARVETAANRVLSDPEFAGQFAAYHLAVTGRPVGGLLQEYFRQVNNQHNARYRTASPISVNKLAP